MIIQRWNFKTEVYEPYEVPNSNHKVSIYENDLDTLVACAGCGEDIKYGDCYTSRAIHTHLGMGYCVCDKCYQKEWEEERNK